MQVSRRQWMGVAAGAAPQRVFGARLPIAKGPFLPEWDSLRQYKCPDWFRDAKLGIWSVWGPECVPEQGDWYARHMYEEGHAHYKHHLIGPRKDVAGLWRDAATKRGLRFGVTEHLGAGWGWFGMSKRSDKEGVLAGVTFDGIKQEFAGLYHSGNDSSKGWYSERTPDSFKLEWFRRIVLRIEGAASRVKE